MKPSGFFAVLTAFLLPIGARAQLVADGQTNVLDGVATNVSDGVTIGTNGAFTLLIVTNGAAVTNSGGNLVIGFNASAQSNRVAVTGTGSSWNCPSGSIVAGQSGSANELDILKGGLVTSSGGTVGASGSSNLVFISDADSLWQVSSLINVGGGSSGGNNQVILANGGMINSGTVQIGPNFASNNAAWVIGPGSVWTNSGSFFVGGYSRSLLVVSNGGKIFSGMSSVGQGSFNSGSMAVITGAGSSWTSGYFYLGYTTRGMHQLIINNGGAFNTSSTCDIGVYANSNILTVADAGSSLQCQTFRIGYSSTSNQCIVSNGATLTVTLSSQPTMIEGISTSVTITGAGSHWTNYGDFQFGQTSNVLSVTSGGALSANNNLYVGYSGNRNQMVVGNLGIVTIANQLQIGSSGGYSSNTVTINGGTVIASNSATMANHGTLALNSGLFKAASLTTDSGASASRIIFSGGTLQSGGMSYGNAAPLVVGDGTNAATYQLLNGTHTFSGGLVVSSSGLLTGAGTLNGNITIGNGGMLVPGTSNSFSTSINNGLVLSAGSTTVMRVVPISGASDRVQNMSSVVYGGTLQITNTEPDSAYASGQSFKLFSSGQYSGAFSNVVPSSPRAGLRWDTSELTVDGVLRIFSAHSPPPVLGSNVAIANGNLILSVSAGIPYDPVYLLTSTNLALPVSSWTCCSTNHFDTNGTVSITNAIVPGESQKFFRLQVQ